MASRGQSSVYFPGLPEFIRKLELAPEAIRRAEFEWERAAASTLVQRAKALARAEGSTAGKAEADISLRGNSAILGGHAYDMGAEYGSIVYKQFKAWRGNGEGSGYFFWPAVREFEDKSLTDSWDEIVWDAFKEAFE